MEREIDQLNVTEIIEYRNIGNEPFYIIRVNLPNDYDNLEGVKSCCFSSVFDNDTFIYTLTPLFPNETKTLEFEYTITPKASEYRYSKEIYYGTERTLIILEQDFLNAGTSENLFFRGTEEIDQREFGLYAASGLFPEESVHLDTTGYEFSLSDIDLTNPIDFISSLFRIALLQILWILIGTLILLIIGITAFGFSNRKRVYGHSTSDSISWKMIVHFKITLREYHTRGSFVN
jgi:hypothetical protein